MTASTRRPFDLVVWGATGFTGRLVAEALAALAPAGLRWAVAGRDRKRVAAVAATLGPDVGTLVADAGDPASLRALAEATAVVLTTVGPYARTGTPLVAACVAAGTDVADLSGEVTWMRRTVDAFHAAARERGVRVVHACGFDSVPSDLGVWCLQRLALARHGRPAERVEHVFGPMSGGISGGTFASMLALVEEAVREPTVRAALADRDLLAPGGAPSSAVRDPWWPQPAPDGAGFTAPFPMAAVNRQAVRRTRALLGEPWGTGFRYRERWRAGRWVAAAGIGAGWALVPLLLAIGPVRRAAARRGPQPGDGPSAEARARGFFRSTLTGWVPGVDEPVVVTVAADLDPGYGATARMLAAVGLGLADGGFAAAPGGVITPALLGADALVARLERAGLRFRVAGADAEVPAPWCTRQDSNLGPTA